VLYNIAYVINTNSKGETNYLTRNQYIIEIAKTLYARDALDNKRGHRIKWEKHHRLDTVWYMARQSYGNGFVDEWAIMTMPSQSGYREHDVVSHAYRVECIDSGKHRLIEWWAVIDDKICTATYDETTRTWVG